MVPLPIAGAQPMRRNLQYTADSLWSVHEVNVAAKFIGDQLAHHARAESGSSRRHHNRTAALLPVDAKPALRMSVLPETPAHRYMAGRGRKRAKFRRVGSELVEHHGKCLARLGT